ncbi:hypothetical protein RUM4293_03378 [Ruegeria atlantica]|uniref:Uncharacterized protein n=1 Tax=Ruegeria atlantica TaxID=81569 RepID=A0A0N7LP80_9RHOB|nr:hypothetical protein RUM4293_03378 [Ruegeria atlantica]
MTGDSHPDEPARYAALVTLGSKQSSAAACAKDRSAAIALLLNRECRDLSDVVRGWHRRLL